MAQKHGLGRGLSSLIPQKPKTQKDSSSPGASAAVPHLSGTRRTPQNRTHTDTPTHDTTPTPTASNGDYVTEIAPGKIRANSQQPRVHFDERKLDELTQSIQSHGVLQPLVVVQKGDRYELIAGERRLRASRKAGLKTVPAIVKNDATFSEQHKLEMALIENIQRHDLNLIEEARSYHKLAEEFDLSQEEIAVRCGKSRSAVANRMRLCTLPVEIQKALIAGDITEGHAKVILSVHNPQKQLALYHTITQKNLTVRQAEHTAQRIGEGTRKKRMHPQKTLHARRLEEQLARYFDTKVRVQENNNGGNITISYFSDEELKNVLSRLKLS